MFEKLNKVSQHDLNYELKRSFTEEYMVNIDKGVQDFKDGDDLICAEATSELDEEFKRISSNQAHKISKNTHIIESVKEINEI